MAYVGFWPRVGAYLIDFIILFVVNIIVSIILPQELAMIINLATVIIYETYFISSKYQATPGKMALGMIVVKPDGSPVNLPNAIGRVLGKYLSSIILCIGYIMVAFTEKKQGLHDMLAKTVVISRAPASMPTTMPMV